jgi:hypothetical protein
MNISPESRSDTVGLATRTLVAAGYSISGVHRQPTHIEFKCERTTRLGAIFQLLIAITDEPFFRSNQITEIGREAQNQSRAAVFVSSDGAPGQLSRADFLEAMGGAVPPWRVLTPEFAQHLITASQNKLPPGLSGEAWRLFEELTADGLELCFGRRVTRMGSYQRGKRVSDMVAPLPDFDVVVVDAKASEAGYDASSPSFRPLAEYVEKQKVRQRGGGQVVAALVISSQFVQDEAALAKVAREFLGETRTPLCFITADTLAHLVKQLLGRADIRGAMRWNMIFSGGLITRQILEAEINAASQERCELREQ